MIVKLTVEGTQYEYDGDRLLVAEARELKAHTGFTPPKWFAALDESDPDAIAFLIYLAKKRAGETLRFSDLDSLDYADFEFEMEFVAPEAEQAADQAEVQSEPDPTPASGETGTTPTPDTSATSEPSPTTSSTPPPTSAP
ncbi:hypothetical protein ACFOOM_12100 [Streptomyces echinoruber]|uniref:Uncharacterized protein n=1 Tax=Streptomyces echinoruber TaxID=68898 RepID=A0A918RKE9_9ACTN|nr:hypothetical protein [Streptomyces echinoruber]GHA01520.1 hypothetical protein GCM10010389_46120 [Streptomyces echinoruber]